MSQLSKIHLPRYRSIDSSWETDEFICLPFLNGQLGQHFCLVHHNKNKYIFQYGLKYQIFRYLENGLLSMLHLNSLEAKQLVFIKDGYSVFSLRHSGGILSEVCFHHMWNKHMWNKLSRISKISTTQGIGDEYAITCGPYLSFRINKLGSKNHEMTRLIDYKERSFKYYDKCFNIYQRFLEEKLNEIY